MPSWLARKPPGAKAVPGFSQQHTAQALGATLEERAQQLTSPQSAAWLLARWTEHSACGELEYELKDGDIWYLTFFQVLLRSSAFEHMIGVCTRVPALRAALAEGGTLAAPLRAFAELVLLPGAIALWPSLLETLLADDSAGGPLPWSSWARRLATALKRPWRAELWPEALRQLDRQLLSSAQAQEEAPAVAGTALLQGGQMSRAGIRAALLRRQMPQCAAVASRLRARAELLCEACELLKSGLEGSNEREAEQLLADADVASASLDAGLEGSSVEHEAIGKTFSDIGAGLQQQIAGLMLTQESFSKQKGALLDERDRLAKRIQDIDAEVAQLDKESAKCSVQLGDLRARFTQSANHYDGLVEGSLCSQQRWSERKHRAASSQQCAREAVAIARSATARRNAELAAARRRRGAELTVACAAYVRHERTRLGLASEALLGCRTGGSDISEDMASCVAAAQDAWRCAQAVLQRVDAITGTEKALGAEVLDAIALPESPSGTETGLGTEASQHFFAQEAANGRCFCVDCNAPGADWASVSHGTYLCVDCAGKHRGLGVHVSFVRSLLMDRWSQSQLRRMQLGGNDRFYAFLERYPGLQASQVPLDSAALQRRYHSRAVAFYRRSLAAASADQALAAQPPEADEGLLPDEFPDASSEDAGASGNLSNATASLEQERRSLQEAYLEHQRRLQDTLVPGGI